jgi:lysophospholipid hydrolase
VLTAYAMSNELLGGLQLLTAEPAFYTFKTRTATRIAYMTSTDFYELMERKPTIILPVCKSILSRLSPFLRGIDFALDWRMIDSGQALFRQDDSADCLHVVLSGRLRSVIANGEKKEAIEEFGRGDLVGLVCVCYIVMSL